MSELFRGNKMAACAITSVVLVVQGRLPIDGPLLAIATITIMIYRDNDARLQ